MPLGRISLLLSAYPNTRIAVKDQFGSPIRMYLDAAGTAPVAEVGVFVTDAAGNLDFYAQDDRSYILEVWGPNGLVDRMSGIDVAASSGFPAPTGRGTIPVGTSRTLTAADNGMILECTAPVTLSVPTGLPNGFMCTVLPNATTSIASLGAVALLNGATTTLTRAAATPANAVLFIVKRASAANSFAVNGS